MVITKEKIEKLKNIDVDTILEFYQEFYYNILKYTIFLTNDRHISEVIVHDFFIKLPLKVRKFEQGNFKIWLFVCVKNFVYDYLKLNSNNNISFDENIHFKTTNPNNFQIFELIEVLSPIEYEIIILHFFVGFTFKEIRIFLHLSEYQLKKHLKMSYKTIKNYYKSIYL